MRVKRFIEAETAAAPPRQEESLCGVLVHVVPERIDAVSDELARLPGVEIHARTDNGRLVVTIEDAAGEKASATLTRIPAIGGVIAASLVYQSTLPLPSSEEPTP
jgi:nitrate reductase NapD